jgi:NADH dehydrogenase
VLVVGGGFAGGYVARLLGKRGATIVSPENFMLYTPMLPEAASGTLEPRHTVVPLRQMAPHAELLLGRVTGIVEERQSAVVETPDAWSF